MRIRAPAPQLIRVFGGHEVGAVMIWLPYVAAGVITFGELTGAALALRKDSVCGTVVGSTPHHLRESISCLTVPRGLSVCVDAREPAAAKIAVRDRSRELAHWSEHLTISSLREVQVTLADLDGDGLDEIVVATLNNTSNGMAVDYWNVCVVNGAHLVSQPACVETRDYGVMSYLTRAAGSSSCLLLQATWRWGSEPLRGSGLYLVGRWLRYGEFGFLPETSRPIVARRYLYSFQIERGSAQAPLLWFRDARAKPVLCPGALCE